jgi:UDP-hydrolysing UDP-N-acetyl-D-glucosamine 2-epimerase
VIAELEKQGVDHEHLNYEWCQDHNKEFNLREISAWFIGDIADNKIKNILILGDRWETLQIAMIAKLHNINIYHIGGGEVSKGAYDDDFRRAISQLASYHFIVDDNCHERLYQQGIDSENIYVVGSPRLDNDKTNIKKINFPKKTALVIYHPTTKNDNTYQEITELLDSLRYFDMNYIMLYPNKDKGSDIIINEIEDFAMDERVRLQEKVTLDEYYDLINSVDIMIGNSSAGITETASYHLPTVNIGDRQKDRDCNDNVLHAKCEKHDIVKAITTAMTDGFIDYCNDIDNKFGDGKASEKIVKIVKGLL